MAAYVIWSVINIVIDGPELEGFGVRGRGLGGNTPSTFRGCVLRFDVARTMEDPKVVSVGVHYPRRRGGE